MARLTLLGVGAMASPRFAPAGLLVECGPDRVMIDGGPGAEPRREIDAWLLTDARAELIHEIRARARASLLEPEVGHFMRPGSLRISPKPVLHTSHPTFGYRIELGDYLVAWVPEFLVLPRWARGCDSVFADASGWDRPIRFAAGAGGHACALDVAREAKSLGIRKLVFAHIGRPTIRAIDAGLQPPFGQMGQDRQVFLVPGARPLAHGARTG